jgi:AcrR family transcriptional regulator
MEQKSATPGGRPRGFDRNDALQTAMMLFCKHGYEGVSIADLTKAMNIAPPSLYSAFGSKEALYREALALYQQRPGFEMLPEFQRDGPIRERVRTLLHDAVCAATDPDYPAGCMVTAGMLNCGAEHEALADTMSGLRTSRCTAIASRLQKAVETGDLPPGTDALALARYLSAVIQGIAIQARDGATADELFTVVDVAMDRWPSR